MEAYKDLIDYELIKMKKDIKSFKSTKCYEPKFEPIIHEDLIQLSIEFERKYNERINNIEEIIRNYLRL